MTVQDGSWRVPVVRQGEIWVARLSPVVGNEQGGTRPCLVISAGRFNAMPIWQCIVVPLTSRNRHLVNHVVVVDSGGLQRPSWAMCEAVRAVSTRRLGDRVGMADDATVEAVRDQVVAWMQPDRRLLN